jgi:hypothetical protein
MPYKRVTKPIPFPGAFGATSDAAILSQAAILLLLEPGLRRNRVMLSEYRSARRTLRVPTISATARRVKVEEVESPLRLRPLSSAREVHRREGFGVSPATCGKRTPGSRQSDGSDAFTSHPLVRAAAAFPIFHDLGAQSSHRHFGRLYSQRR